MKKLAVVVAGLLVLAGCSSVETEDVSYSLGIDENAEDTRPSDDDVLVEVTPSTDEGELESVDAPIVEEEAVQEDVQVSEPRETETPLPEPSEAPTVNAPIVEDDLGYDLSYEIVDDSICKLRENSATRNSGSLQLASSFPALKHANSLTLNGTLNVKVVFIEWENFKGTQSDYDYHVSQLQKFASFYGMVSEGKLRFNFEFEDSWIQVGTDYNDSYIPSGMDGGDWRSTPFLQGVLDKWMLSVDPVVDFSNGDVVIFPVPRGKTVADGGAHEFPHAPGAYIQADGEKIYSWFAPGVRYMTPGQTPLWTWYSHEFGHALGIPDLRDMSDATKNQIGVIRGEKWLVNPMGGLEVMDNEGGPTITINAWTRWVQGWLNDDQATCVLPENVQTENYYRLSQLNKVGAKDKLLVIKTSATTALLIESRRWDSKFDTPIQHSRNGVIVYRVDTTLGHEEGPLRLYSPRDITKYIYEEKTWPDHRCLDVFLYEGDKVTAQGFTIEVEKLSSSGDIVKIYKSK